MGERRKRWDLILFLYFCFSVYFVMCGSDSNKRREDYGSKASLSPKISTLFGSEKIRDGGFEVVRGFIPDYAILAKDEIKLEGEFLVDGFVSLKGEYGGGNLEVGSVATNGNFKAEGKSKVTGKLFLGPQGVYKIEGGAEVRGGIERLTQSIVIPDFESAFLRAKEYNDNEKIPSEFLKEGVLKLEGGKELELPSGVYYLKGIKLESKSKLRFQGIAFVFLEGGEEKGKGNEKGKRNGKEKNRSNGKGKEQEKGEGEEGFCLSVQSESVLGVFPSELRVIAKCGVKVESKGKIYGFVASGRDVKVEGGGEIFGGVLARKFKGEGKGKVHFDKFLSTSFYMYGNERLGLIFDLRYVILRLSEGVEIDSILGTLEESGINVLGPFYDGTYLGRVRDLVAYQSLSRGIEGVKFVGNPFITVDGYRGLASRGEIIVDLETEDIQGFLRDYSGVLAKELGVRWIIMEVPVRTTFDLLETSRSVENDPRVFYAEPNFRHFSEPDQTVSPDDLGFRLGFQWNLRNINAQGGWAFIYNGELNGVPIFSYTWGVTLAIVDWGVESTHEEFSQILIDGDITPTPSDSHGTEVAGIAGAHTNNGRGIAGVVWGTPGVDLIMPFDDAVTRRQDAVDRAWRRGAVAINASWRHTRSQTLENNIANAVYCGRGGSANCRMRYDSRTGICTLQAGTQGLGSVFVKSAGNTQQGQQTCSVTYPGTLANTDCFRRRMLVVSSIDVNNVISSFSCTGPEVSVSAPGECVFSTTTGNTYVNCIDGTSYAAPHVTGLAGLILKLNPRLSVQDVFDIITRTAIDLGNPGRDNNYGYGRIDVERAVVWTIFRGFSASQEFLSSNSLIIQSAVGSTISAVFQVANGGGSPIFATIRIHPQESGGISVSLPRGTNQAILVISPGQSANISITFRKNTEGPSEGRFTLTYCRDGLALEPQAFNIFGGSQVAYPDFLTPVSFEFLGRVMPLLVRCTDFEITVRTPPVCRDGICEGNENCINCVQDCGSCPPPPGGGSACVSFCKLPLCIPIFCLPKAGCIYICFPPPGWAICPFCCLWCLFVFGDPGPGIPEEIPPELADIMQSPECNLCSESLKSEGGSAFGKPECKLCIEKVVQRGASLSYQCDMCLMNIRDYGEQGADSSWCAICKDQWEAMYEAYKDAVQSTMP
jgi:subtilisin family serine protease